MDSSVSLRESAPRLAGVGYVRVSTDDQVRGSSLDHQREVITQWCDRAGVALLRIFSCDEGGESGGNLEREGLQHLVDFLDADKSRVQFLIVSKIDRLTRRMTDGSLLHEELRNRHINIIAPEDGVTDLAGANAFTVGMLAWIGEMERQRILARVHPGQLARLRSGLPISRLPLGYRIEEGEKTEDARGRPIRKRIAIDPETAPLVKGLFSFAAMTDLGLRRVADWASEHAIARRLKLSFSPLKIRNLLTNRFFLGTLAATFTRENGTDERFEKQDNHSALIQPALFQLVQERLQGRRQLAADHHNDHTATSLLGGIALCQRCGSPVTPGPPAAGSKFAFYLCSQRFMNRCDAQPMPAEFAEAQVALLVQGRLIALASEIAASLMEAIDDLPKVLDQRRAEAAARQRVASERLVHLDTALEEGTMSGGDHAAACAHEHAEMAAAEALLTETDGWAYIAKLVAAQETERDCWRYVPWDLVMARLSLSERRRLIRATFTALSLDASGLVAADQQMSDRNTFIEMLSKGYLGTLATFPGYDVDHHMKVCGWTREETPDGPVWNDENGNHITWRAVAARGGHFKPAKQKPVAPTP